MIQEIITYMIVGSALTIATLNLLKLFKKKKKKKVDFKNEKFSMQHDCDSCAADCMMRDANISEIQNNKELCKKVEIKSKL